MCKINAPIRATSKLIALMVAVLILSISFVGCANNDKDSSETTTTTTTTTAQTEEPISSEPEPDSVVRIVAAGDNLIHSSIYNRAKRAGTNGEYNFDFPYEQVLDYISVADLAILNQETIVNDVFEPSSYPLFSSPTDLGDKMLSMGFNAFSIANNHVIDKGERGLIATLDYWDSKDVPVVGAYRDEEDMNRIRTKTVGGITFSFLGFMEHTNGLSLPESSTCKIIYTDDIKGMKKQVELAREVSDVVIVNIHWGVEVSNTITEEQHSLAQDLVDWGTDIIIGTQPHTVQSMQYLKKPSGDDAFVFYCLGNFISAMSNPKAMVGMLADFNVIKNGESGKITIEDVKAIPLITQFEANYKDARIIPYSEYTQELADLHGLRYSNGFNMELVQSIINENIPEEFLSIE